MYAARVMVARDDRRESWVRVPEARQMIAPGGAMPASANRDRWLAEPELSREKILFRAAQAFVEREARSKTQKCSF